MDFWKKITDLFQQAEDSSPSQPVIHEMIVRTEAQKKDYAFWKSTLVRRQLSDWLIQQYGLFKALPRETDEAIDFLDTPSSKGFVIHLYKTQYSERDATYFFDYLKERVLAAEYRTQISDCRAFNRPQHTEKIERHYLKPKPDFLPEKQEKLNQRFGNVMIELEFRDDNPYRIKFRATGYRDSLFKDTEDFQDLMGILMVAD